MRFWIGLGIFAGVFVIAFVLFVFRITENPAVPPTVATSTAARISDIELTDSYKSGTHKIQGSAVVPSACTGLNASIEAASTSSRIRVDLTAPTDDGVCLDLPTTVPFSLTVTAAQGLPIDVYANGSLATSTL